MNSNDGKEEMSDLGTTTENQLEVLGDFVRLIHTCWEYEADDRPTSAVVVARLDKITMKYSSSWLKQNIGQANAQNC